MGRRAALWPHSERAILCPAHVRMTATAYVCPLCSGVGCVQGHKHMLATAYLGCWFFHMQECCFDHAVCM
jgi:hypothetical protein